MRNLKKFLSVILAIAIMATAMVPALAAEAYTYEAEAEMLYDLGLIAGDGVDFALGKTLTRAEGITMTLKLFGFQEEADTITDEEIDEALAGFADADLVPAWARGWMAIGVREGLVSGVGDSKIDPNGPFTGKQLAALILKQMGKELTLETYNRACAELAAIGGLGIDEILFNDIQLNRDKAFGMMFAALKAQYDDGTTLIDDLVFMGVVDEDKAVAYELISKVEIVDVEDVEVTVNVGEEAVLPEEVEATFSDGSTAYVAVVWEDVDTSEAGTFTVAGTIEGYDIEITATVIVEEVALEVESVTADNLKEVVVTYNIDVEDNDAVADKDNYSLDVEDISSVSVSGNTATLVLADGVENQKEAVLTIGEAILGEEKEESFTFFDATLPEVLGMTITGPKSFVLEFSEPIKTPGTITLKTGSSTLSINTSGISGVNTNELKVPMYSSFAEGKTYTLTVKGFEDFAEYANVVKTFTFEYKADTTPPVAEVVSASQEKVVVAFNKPVKGLTKDHFSHTFTAWKAIKITKSDDWSDGIATSDSVSKVYVWFYHAGTDTGIDEYERPIAEGTTTLRILGKDDAGNKIKDEWGNEFATVTLPITVVADKTAPEVVQLKAIAEDKLYIQFSKDVDFDEDNVEVLDVDGKEIDDVTISVAPSAEDDYDYEIGLGTSLAGKTIIVNIKDVYDTTLSENKLALYSQTIEINDLTAPQVNRVAYDATDKVLYVFYNENVDDSALVAGNYYLVTTTSYIKLTKAGEFYTNEKVVKIPLTDSQAEEVTVGSTKLLVSGVKDVAGNEIDTDLSDAIIALSIYKPEIETAKATSTTTVVIDFNQELGAVAKEAFAIASTTIAAMEVTLNDDGNTRVILTLTDETALDHDTSGVYVTIADEELIENLFGINPDPSASAVIVDKIAPELVADDAIVDDPSTADSFLIKFTEELYEEHKLLYANDLVIKNADGDELVAGVDYKTDLRADAYGELTILVVTVTDGAGTYTVKSKATIGYIKDNSAPNYSDCNFAAAFTDEVEVEVE